MPAAELLAQLEKDTAWLSKRGMGYFDPQVARSVVKRIRRDPEALAQITLAITDNRTSDSWAAQLGSYLAVAYPIDQNVRSALTRHYRQQRGATLPDAIRDRVAAIDLPVPVVLLRALDATADAGTL